MNANYLKQIYHTNLSLHTDLYQLTMAYGYWKNQMHERESVFHLFYRKNPFQGTHAIACGLQLVIDYLENFHFKKAQINYLRTLKGADEQPLFDEMFLNYLTHLKFSCNVDAVPEGTMVFPHEPLIRIKGPIIQAQILETALLNFINFSTLIATKSARIAESANGDSILEFGLRRAQGIDGGLTVARSAFIGGCAATSNVLAGFIYGIPVRGTHAHSWVMSFPDEQTAFQKYAEAMPNNAIFLVDTYDTLQGVEKAIKIGYWLKSKGHKMLGIRLDSGDLAALSKQARSALDRAGFQDCSIVASNDLDEYRIKALKENGAEINIWGVGTRLATAYDQPALGGVYKPGAIRNLDGHWEYQIKLSEDKIKTSNPGILQVRRIYNNGIPIGDVFYDEILPQERQISQVNFEDNEITTFNFEAGEDLLQPIFVKGKLVYEAPNLLEIKKRLKSEQNAFKNINLSRYQIGLEEQLHNIKQQLIHEKTSTSIS